ncbi:hypothetical protein ACFSKW_18225 [Nonomuraea mangrovi]|uniref:Uncharacterized protein n=1 Tax=Nonomuraea mangrovi TaxID=2316207 RepID=A0ABW4SYN5_9ACTN
MASVAKLSGRFPGGPLGTTLNAVALPDGSTDPYIRQERYRQRFTADLSPGRATLDAVAPAAVERPGAQCLPPRRRRRRHPPGRQSHRLTTLAAVGPAVTAAQSRRRSDAKPRNSMIGLSGCSVTQSCGSGPR